MKKSDFFFQMLLDQNEVKVGYEIDFKFNRMLVCVFSL